MLLKNLDETSYSDIKLVGGKAASLGEMIGAGLPVPSGFVVTTDGFRAGMTHMLEQEILKAFDMLGAKRVAVRSSAVAEDSGDASWAGQLESYLNTTRGDLIANIKKCWDSIDSDRAKDYVAQNNVNDDQRAVAVVVQAMVDSEVSGVMFTANPVTNNREEIMLEAIYGLGEMLVQGTVTPESIVLKKDGTVVSRSLHCQAKKLIWRDGKNIEADLEVEPLDKPILNDIQIKRLVDLAGRIEAHYGMPQDIEWAYANDLLFAVQSRPITTL